jgi:preprotein translocase subunit SecA
VIDEHWVDFINEMESLRYEVRLEGWAHNDPVVVYKTKSAQRYQALLENLRLGVVSRLFTVQPDEVENNSEHASQVEQPDPKLSYFKLG